MMKITLTVLMLLAVLASPAAARQETPQRPEDAQQRLEQLKERLALTPEQVEEVRPLLADEAKRLRALRAKHEGTGGQSRRDRRNMAKELRDIQADTNAKLKKVLSKRQMDELAKLREEWRREFRGRTR